MQQIKIDDPTLLKHLKDFLEEGWWKGFSERDSSRDPTIHEKQQMIRYPHISSIIQLSLLPLLSAKITFKGDETQKDFIELWLKRYYRRLARMICSKSYTWGYCVGERVFGPVKMNKKPYWMLKGLIMPRPYDCRLTFKEDPIEIDGFIYANDKVKRFTKNTEQKIPGMIYYSFRGDEISLPYGDSLLNDMFWAWQLVMKEWTSAAVYDRLHAPIWALYYIPEYKGEGENKTDVAQADAIKKLKDTKNTAGMVLPKVKNEKNEWVKGYEFEEVTAQDREPKFMERIKTLNTMMYIGSLMPERLVEQFKAQGSEAMVKVQRGFYEENVIGTRLEEHQEYMRLWIFDPMLELNFGKVDLEIDMKLQDKTIEFFIEILKGTIQQGYIPNLDLNKMAQQVGLPVNPTHPTPEIIKEERRFYPGIEFQTKSKIPTKKQIREKANEIAKPWVNKLNNKLNPLKTKCYNEIADNLTKIQGKIGLEIMKKKNNEISVSDLASLVQIPRNIFTIIENYLNQAFMVGMAPVMKEGKEPLPDDIPLDAKRELSFIKKKFEGISGKYTIGGQPERLEERLFYAIYSAKPIHGDLATARLKAFNDAFDNYVKLTLVDNVGNELNIAMNMGILYASKELQRRDLEKKKAGE